MPNRISTNQIFDRTQAHIAKAREKEIGSAEKSSTFKEIVRPSQNPIGWITANRLKNDLSIRDTMAKNDSMGMHVLNMTETVLSQVQDYTQKGHELALAAAGRDPYSDGAREHIYKDACQLYESVIQSLNTKYGNRTLLSGFKTESPAFDISGEYLGDDNKLMIEVDHGLKVPLNIPGSQAILGQGLKDGVNIVGLFKRLVQSLGDDDIEGVRGTLEDFERANRQMSVIRTEVGGWMTQVDRATNSHASVSLESKIAVSKIEEADSIKVFSDLARDQAVLKASIL